MSAGIEPRTMRRLHALREDVAVESDDDTVTLLAPWGDMELGPAGRVAERSLRRLALGPVDLNNLEPGEHAALDALLGSVSGAVVHSLVLPGRESAGLSVVPIAAEAPFEPRPVHPTEVVRLSRLAVIRPWAGRLVVSAPGTRHEIVCEGPALGALLVRLATGRQVSDLSGRSESEDIEGPPCLEGATSQDVEDVLGWLVAAGVLECRRSDGTYAGDDGALAGWSPHELEFEARTRRPGQAVEERFRLREGVQVGPVTREPFPGRVLALSGGDRREPVDEVLAPDYRAPAFSGRVLTTGALGDLLFRSARVRSHRQPSVRTPSRGIRSTQRPYLSVAWLYELEIYVALGHADTGQGVYHYDPDTHALTDTRQPNSAVGDILRACAGQVGPQPESPAAVMLITCRRARSDWALGSVTHAHGLAEAGALTQVLHLVGRSCGVAVHPVPLGAAEGWRTLVEELWPAEVPVGVCSLDVPDEH